MKSTILLQSLLYKFRNGYWRIAKFSSNDLFEQVTSFIEKIKQRKKRERENDYITRDKDTNEECNNDNTLLTDWSYNYVNLLDYLIHFDDYLFSDIYIF